MSTEITTPATSAISPFMSSEQFAALMEQATVYASSDLVPKEYQGKPANVIIAMELAARLGAGWFQIMQNMTPINGKPSFSATFLMAMISASGRFEPLEYRMEVTGPEKTVVLEYSEREGFGQNAKYVQKKLNYTYTPTTCRAVGIDKRTGKEVVGPPVSYDMAIEQSWISKAGSKWQGPMRELMLTYRAGSFFARVYASDLTLGISSTEEVRDTMPYIDVQSEVMDQRQPATPSTTNPHRVAAQADPAPAGETTAPAAAAPTTRKRTPKPGTPAAAESVKPAPEPAKPAQRGEIVFYEGCEFKDGESSGKPWRKFTVAFSKSDGTTGHASTFDTKTVDPLETLEQGARIAIETKEAGNPKYYPTLTWLEVLADEEPAPEPAKRPAEEENDESPFGRAKSGGDVMGDGY